VGEKIKKESAQGRADSRGDEKTWSSKTWGEVETVNRRKGAQKKPPPTQPQKKQKNPPRKPPKHAKNAKTHGKNKKTQTHTPSPPPPHQTQKKRTVKPRPTKQSLKR